MQQISGDSTRYLVAQTQASWNHLARWIKEMDLLRCQSELGALIGPFPLNNVSRALFNKSLTRVEPSYWLAQQLCRDDGE